MPVDLNSEVSLVRNIVGDMDSFNYILQDDEYSGFLQVAGGTAFGRTRIFEAASMAMYRIASSRALIAKAKKLYMLSVDDTKAVPLLMMFAERLKQTSQEGGGLQINALTISDGLVTKWVNDKEDYSEAISDLFNSGV